MLGRIAFLLQKFIKSKLENQPQQLAQRANFNITTSTPKTIKTSKILK